MTDATLAPLKTPLHGLHLALKAKMTPFAGYDMPLQYEAGILAEHLHVRKAAGLFDVSHMGQVTVRAKSGRVEDAAAALERLVPVDILGLPPGRQRYAFFTNAAGGIIDDIMVANRGVFISVVVNAAGKVADLAHMQAGLPDCEVTLHDDRALLALQGPGAEAALMLLAPGVLSMKFMDVRAMTVASIPAVVSRSGYTGEDGFEIAVPAKDAVRVAELLLGRPGVLPIGLGARDSLRLEAGLCLYGNDIDTTTTPVEAALSWAIQKVRRRGGPRAGGFPGADVILRQLEDGPARLRVGLRPDGKAPVRAHAGLFAAGAGLAASPLPSPPPQAGEGAGKIGEVTSGGFGPSVNGPVAMGYVPAAMAAPGTALLAEVRGRMLPVTVAPLPFVPNTFKR